MQNTVYDMDRFGFGGGPDPDNIDDLGGGSPSSQRPAALGDAKPLPKSVRVARQNESGKLKGGYSAPTVQRRQGLQTEAIPAALQPMPTVSFPSSVVLSSAPAPAVQTAAHWVGARRATTKIRVCPRQFPDKPHYQFCQKQFLLVQESESCPSSGFDPMHSRFYFHLTNGEDVIGDEVGAPAADVHAAVSYALEAIEQLRAEDPLAVAEWLGWTLEVTDEMGRIIETFSLDDPLSKTSPRH